MSVFRCDFCGRFFSSELPEAYGCPNHWREAHAALKKSIDASNAKLAARLQAEKDAR